MRPDRLSILTVALLALCVLAWSVPAAAQTGLVAAYGFDEGSGTTLTDLSGNGNNGAVSGATWSASGRYGGALSFDGATNWVTVNNSASISLTTGMTIEAWVKTPADTNWRCVVLKERTGGLSYGLYSGDTNGYPAGYIRPASDIDATSSSLLPLNTWVHLATTYDGATLRLYVNGVQAAATAMTGNIVTSTSPLRIGGDSVWGEYFKGLIDEVRIYNRALGQSEIQTDMATPVGAAPVPTYSISGSVMPAASGNGTNIAVTGPASATVTADSNGNFTVPSLPSGSYTLTPTKTGFSFSPVSQSVTIGSANVTGVTFAATSTAPPPSSVQMVQKAVNGSEPAVGTISVAFPQSNTAGDVLIVTGAAARPAGTLTIADSLGNTYLPAIGPTNDSVQDANVYIWYVINCKGGSNTVTITPTSARALEIHVSEWSGLQSFDTAASGVGNGTAVSTAAASTSVAGELIYGYAFVAYDATAGAGFTALSLVNGDLDEYAIQTAPGLASATFTQNPGAWLAVAAMFRPAVVNGPTVFVTAPSNASTVAGPVPLSATATDSVGIAGVQFQIDGVNTGPVVTTPPYSITWDSTTATNAQHSITAVATNVSGTSATSTVVTVTVDNSGTPAVAGAWAPPSDIGMVSVHMALMHTGKVLMFAGSFQATYPEQVWDPATGAITSVPNPYYNLFCAGHVQLPDGRILVVGGHDPATLGVANANIFDPGSMTWSALPNMAYRRWYPTATGLPDGRVLVTSGAQTCATCLADVPEIFDPAASKFTALTSARLGIDYYPFMFVLPDGRVLSAGSNESAYETRTLDISSGTWTMVDPVIRDGHSAVMYRLGKVLKTGTAADSGTVGNAAPTAYVIDMTQPSPTWRQVASMTFPRAFQNSTLLPDGNVLITGGGTTLDGHDTSKAVLTPELWSPTTETFRTLAPSKVPRLYHSGALLLPDGRVLIAGGGDDAGAVNETQAEIYSPPYLFKGARPGILAGPDLIQYGAAFQVTTQDSTVIGTVVLMRLGSVTHAFDEDQRYIELPFTAGSGGLLTVTAPANANLAPPGYYMLFVVNKSGIPSVASFVHFPAPSADSTPPTPPTALAAVGSIGRADLSWGASTDNVGVTLYNVYRSTVSGFTPGTTNRIAQVTGSLAYADIAAPATYFYRVTAQDAAGNISAPSNEASAMVISDTIPPSVSITAPADQSTQSGTITITAAASDNVAVVGVQFQIDGVALGSEDTTAPYSINWSTGTVVNGAHTVTAIARDAAGNRAQASIGVTVSNTIQQPSGLVAAYAFDENIGTTVTDSSGLGNSGTVSNTTWTTGHSGSALKFNGTSSWVTIAPAASLNLSTGMTLEAWVNPSTGSGWRSVILKERSGGLSYALYSSNGASRPGGWTDNGGNDYFVLGNAAVALNTWTHLAVTYDGTSLRFYTNGVLVNTEAGIPTILQGSGSLRVGGDSIWGEYFRGVIDDVRVYNRALSVDEIQRDMTTPVK